MMGVVIGTALQLQQPELWPLALYAAATVLLAVAAVWQWRYGPRQGRWITWVLAAALAGSATGWRAAWMQSHALVDALEGHDVLVQGVISDMPQPLERGMRLRLSVEHAWRGQHAVQLPPLLGLTWYGTLPPQGLQAGQRWQWTVRLKAPHGDLNPHGRDGELWLWSQGIQATGYVRTGKAIQAPQWLGQTWQAPLARWRGQLHGAMQAPAGADAREQASWGVVQALVTGAQSSMTAGDWQLFRDTGIAHLVSISGLHITMFAWLAVALVHVGCKRSARLCLWCPAPTAAAWGGLALAAVYALFSGWGIPAQRTIGMLAIVVMLRTQGRAWPWPYVWLVVLTAVVLADPWSLLQAGFWLSFVAVGVLFAAQPQSMQPRGWRGAGRRLLKEQLVVGLALAPLTLLLFGQISLVGMFVNLWAIPWVTLVVTPLSMLGVLCPALWAGAAQCVTWMVGALECMATWPQAVLYFAQPPWWAAAAGLLACLWMAMPLPWRWRWLGLPFVLPMLWWQPQAPAWGQFELLALDVGQGSAILLRTQRHSLLFDAGPRWSAQSDAGARTVVPVMRALGVRLDAQMVSHADVDHAGGAVSVQQAFPQLQWMGSGGQACQAGQRWEWEGVQFQVLHPEFARRTSAKAAAVGASNANSCVLRVQSHDGRRALLTGDIEAAQERDLVVAGTDMRADVIVVPHHGSASSSSAIFIQAVQPSLAIVQAGYRNRFGHPAPSVVARYRAAQSQVAVTSVCGAAHWSSQMPQAWSCERQLRRRYWQHRP